MSPEGARVVAAATKVFAHLDAMIGDLAFRSAVDVLRRFVFGELGIPIAGEQGERVRGPVTMTCSSKGAVLALFRIAALVLPGQRSVTPEEIERAVERLIDRR